MLGVETVQAPVAICSGACLCVCSEKKKCLQVLLSNLSTTPFCTGRIDHLDFQIRHVRVKARRVRKRMKLGALTEFDRAACLAQLQEAERRLEALGSELDGHRAMVLQLKRNTAACLAEATRADEKVRGDDVCRRVSRRVPRRV